jgi:hypothetical protein
MMAILFLAMPCGRRRTACPDVPVLLEKAIAKAYSTIPSRRTGLYWLISLCSWRGPTTQWTSFMCFSSKVSVFRVVHSILITNILGSLLIHRWSVFNAVAKRQRYSC